MKAMDDKGIKFNLNVSLRRNKTTENEVINENINHE